MALVLVVVNPFGDLQRGDRITDAAKIEEILSGEQVHHVVKSDHADIHEPSLEGVDY